MTRKKLLILLGCVAGIGLLIGLLVSFVIVGHTPPSYTPTYIPTYAPTTPSQYEAYITPNDYTVQYYLDYILDNKPWYRTDFGAIQQWVDENIIYKDDSSVHGVSDYWQKSTETLRLRTGDCEDIAVLLCTLFRAYGIPADEIYVVTGSNSSGVGHAFIMENYYYQHYFPYSSASEAWRIIEPQEGGLFSGDAGETNSQYNRNVKCFNDQYYFDRAPYPWQ